MNCNSFSMLTGWDCRPAGDHALRVLAPMTFGDDGEVTSFIILEDYPGHFYLTDAHATVENAVSRGIKLTKARLASLQKLPGSALARLTETWEITATGSMDFLKDALWDALRLSVSISSKAYEWQPRTNQEKFTAKIQKALKVRLGERVLNSFKIEGSSGHQLEFPIGIAHEDYVQAVQPIGLADDGRLDWGFVYQVFGKLADLEPVSARGIPNRLVIMQASNSEDWKQAASLLSNSASVIAYTNDEDLRLVA